MVDHGGELPQVTAMQLQPHDIQISDYVSEQLSCDLCHSWLHVSCRSWLHISHSWLHIAHSWLHISHYWLHVSLHFKSRLMDLISPDTFLCFLLFASARCRCACPVPSGVAARPFTMTTSWLKTSKRCKNLCPKSSTPSNSFRV